MTPLPQLRTERELWKYIYCNFPVAKGLRLSALPDFNYRWAEEYYLQDPISRPELLTTRHRRIIKAVERQARQYQQQFMVS